MAPHGNKEGLQIFPRGFFKVLREFEQSLGGPIGNGSGAFIEFIVDICQFCIGAAFELALEFRIN